MASIGSLLARTNNFYLQQWGYLEVVLATLLNKKYPHKEKLIGDIVAKAVKLGGEKMESAKASWDELKQCVAEGNKKRFAREELPFGPLLLQCAPYKMDFSEFELDLNEYYVAKGEQRYFVMPVGWNVQLEEQAKTQNKDLFANCAEFGSRNHVHNPFQLICVYLEYKEILWAKKCKEEAYGKGRHPSLAYDVKLTERSAKLLGRDQETPYPVTYQMLNVQKASHVHLLNFNYKMGFSVDPEVLHVGTAG